MEKYRYQRYHRYRVGLLMTSSWKDSLKSSAVEALRKASADLLKPARDLLRDLEKAGKTVTLNPTSDGLIVSPGPVPDDLAQRIRQHKPELLEVLKGACAVWRWKPSDLVIDVSLSESKVNDFFLAPPVDGLPQAALKPGVVQALLAGADERWRKAVKELGGLAAYPMSAKERVTEALKAKASQP